MQPYVMLRLKSDVRTVVVNGRTLAQHSVFSNLHAVPVSDALQLVEARKAKLLPHLSVDILRRQVEAATPRRPATR